VQPTVETAIVSALLALCGSLGCGLDVSGAGGEDGSDATAGDDTGAAEAGTVDVLDDDVAPSSPDAPDGVAKEDAIGDDAAGDAAKEAGTDAGWTNTCPGTVPPGATQCDGNTACFERKAGDCSNASGDCMQCTTTQICCVNAGGNVFCESDPSECP
jgi:hypothetical protein